MFSILPPHARVENQNLSTSLLVHSLRTRWRKKRRAEFGSRCSRAPSAPPGRRGCPRAACRRRRSRARCWRRERAPSPSPSAPPSGARRAARASRPGGSAAARSPAGKHAGKHAENAPGALRRAGERLVPGGPAAAAAAAPAAAAGARGGSRPRPAALPHPGHGWGLPLPPLERAPRDVPGKRFYSLFLV